MILFVVPAYNEEANVRGLVERTDAFAKKEGLPYRLIVVDDGSSDATASVLAGMAASYPLEPISYKPNRGVGEAFRRGMNAALAAAAPSDMIVTMEADGTSDLSILPTMLGKIGVGCDVTLASCYAEGGGVRGTTWFRRLLSRVANFLINFAFRIKGIRTYSSFYRAYKPQTLRRVLEKYGDFYEEKGFACVLELLVRMARLGMRIEEVPMILRGDQRVGKSKMKVGRTILGYLRVIGRNALVRA